MPEPLQLVGHLPELAGARVERRLSGGPLSDKWLLASAAGRWVLRKDKPLALQLDLRRDAELGIREILAAGGWCDNAMWADVRQGILLVPYVPGRVWTVSDMRQPGQLGRLARLLWRLHDSELQAPLFCLGERVASYARYLGTRAAAKSAAKVCQLLATTADSQPAVVCHNDPVAANIVDDGELHLIDFEFAAAGHPLFDIAAVIEHHCLTPGCVEVFVEAYVQAGGSCDRGALEHWRTIYGQTVSLWNQVVAAD